MANSFELIRQQMDAANVRWSLAVAMAATGAYDCQSYPRACTQTGPRMFPVAFLPLSEFRSESELEQRIEHIQELGYIGVKIHPRISRIDFGHALLPVAIRAANRRRLTPLLCTYFYSSDRACGQCSPETLRQLLLEVPTDRMVLLHAGGVRLLEVAEMTRPFKQVLLDVSFTLCEYAGSSLDLDLRYVFHRCSHRVCIGSDSPEMSLGAMRERFEQLTQGLEDRSRERIAHRNLFSFLDLAP